MTRGLRFQFDERPAVNAPLNESNAPVNSRTLWGALSSPVTVLASHAIYSGPEILLNLPEHARTFSPTDMPAENQHLDHPANHFSIGISKLGRGHCAMQAEQDSVRALPRN